MRFKGKKVFVTGADGFIGSHLCEQLLLEGAEVSAMVYYNAFGHWGWLDDLPRDFRNNIKIVMGDVRDPHSTSSAMKGMDLVFHLAALIGIPYSYHAPQSYVETNVNGTLNVLQAARDHGLSRLLVCSTSEVYGTARKVPIEESHPRQAQSPYSASKIAADALAIAYNRSFSLPVAIARPFNTYGPRQSARAIIPTIITQLLGGREVLNLGSLHPTRDLVYVKDSVEGLIRIMLSDYCIGQETNISTGTEISMGKLAEKLLHSINPAARIGQEESRVRPPDSEVERLLGSAELLLERTGWKPDSTLDDGLEQTIAWFRNRSDGNRYKSNVYTV